MGKSRSASGDLSLNGKASDLPLLPCQIRVKLRKLLMVELVELVYGPDRIQACGLEAIITSR